MPVSSYNPANLRIRVTDNVTLIQPSANTSADSLLKFSLESATSNWILAESRNGPVARAPGLFITEYPAEFVPVLRSPLRDANPFFHLVEAFYYLAGRKDVKLPAYFAKQLAAYSDDGETLWGSYGYRWRSHFKIDQLEIIIQELIKDPTSRRCVLQMWDGYMDLNIATGTGGSFKGLDTPCNTSVTFDPKPDGTLNMTVSNRSNDLVWGAYGANMVHFNFLHAYVAAACGMQKGVHFQVSSNTHIYLENPVVKRLVNLVDGKIKLTEAYDKEDTLLTVDKAESLNYGFLFGRDALSPSDAEGAPRYEDELNGVLDSFLTSVDDGTQMNWKLFDTPFASIYAVLLPAMDTYLLHKRGEKEPLRFLTGSQIAWNMACIEWLNRRAK